MECKNRKLFKLIEDNIYKFSATISLGLNYELYEKLSNPRSRKIKKGMTIIFRAISAFHVSVWDENLNDILFQIFDEPELLETVQREKNEAAIGILSDATIVDGSKLQLDMYIKCQKMLKKFVIEEDSNNHSQEEQNVNDESIQTELPLSEEVIAFIHKESKRVQYNGMPTDFRITVPFFDKQKVCLYDMRTNKVCLTIYDPKVLRKIQDFGTAIGRLQDIDIPDDSKVKITISLRHPKNELTLEEFVKDGPYNLRLTNIAVWINFFKEGETPKRMCIMNGNIRTNVVGSDYIEDYHSFENQIKEGDVVKLIKNPENPYDNNAIAVYWKSKRIGYIPRTNIPIVALCMDKDELDAVVYENNLGWIALYVTPNLKNVGNPMIIEKFGDYNFEVNNEESCLTIDKNEFGKIFYYE